MVPRVVKRILTGIKPTGSPHIGNYLGAIRPALQLAQLPDTQAMYFIADYHALTSVHPPEHSAEEMDRQTRDVASTWIAFGLDPEKTLFYRQSDIPEVFELAWIFACFSPKGWMNKMHAYKAHLDDAAAKGIPEEERDAGIDVGTYTYPILMAADIVLFDADYVPVGKDQKQHVEIARDMAQRINHAYKKQVLKLPEAKVDEQTAVVPGLDGRKMSKSYDNTIPLLAPAKQLRKTVMKIVTDSTPPEAPKDPDTSLIFTLYKQFATPEQVAELRTRYASGIGWGEAKGALADAIEAVVAEPRKVYDDLMADRARLDKLLAQGAEKARACAGPVLARVRDAIGVRRA
jgi:tryptophanyl-tRNA synthetase